MKGLYPISKIQLNSTEKYQKSALMSDKNTIIEDINGINFNENNSIFSLCDFFKNSKYNFEAILVIILN